MAVKLDVVKDEGTRFVYLLVDGAPDITPEQSCLKPTIRPEQLTLEYVSEGLNDWKLRKVIASGRMVTVATGEISRTTLRRHSAQWTDVEGTGKIHKAVTPKWVVDLAKRFPTPDALPHKR